MSHDHHQKPSFSNPDMGFIGWTTRCLAPYWRWWIVVGLALVTQAAFRVMVPIGYQAIFDEAIAEKDQALLATILLFLMGGWLLHGVAGLIQDYLAAWITSRAMYALRERMFRQLQRLSTAFYARADTGDLMSRFSNDLSVVEQALARSVYTVLFSSLILGGSLILLFAVEWRLATLTLAALFVSLAVPQVLSKSAHDRAYERKASEAEVSAAVQESIGAQSMVRIFDLREYTLRHFRTRLKQLAETTVATYFSAALVGRTASQSVFLVQILIMGLGGWMAIDGTLSTGALVGFVALLLNVSNASNQLAAVAPELLRASGGARRVREFLDEEPAPEPVVGISLPRLTREIVFDEVRFAYDEAGPTLDRISFSIRAGESVALVGSSGSGKSTLLHLLLRLYDPESGSVRFDGIDIRRATETSILDQIGIVQQETVLLKASFAENIRLGKLGATDQEIVRAAKLAEIHDAILAKPRGYDHQVGEGGRHLSVGQRQRLAIARAILRDPTILVLDEATSALDPTTESGIHRTLVEVGRGRTVISATHRLASVVDFDRVLVIDRGRLIEEGNHHQLLDQRGAYYRLWKEQLAGEIQGDGVPAEAITRHLRLSPVLAS